jgi:hypothetical protein
LTVQIDRLGQQVAHRTILVLSNDLFNDLLKSIRDETLRFTYLMTFPFEAVAAATRRSSF